MYVSMNTFDHEIASSIHHPSSFSLLAVLTTAVFPIDRVVYTEKFIFLVLWNISMHQRSLPIIAVILIIPISGFLFRCKPLLIVKPHWQQLTEKELLDLTLLKSARSVRWRIKGTGITNCSKIHLYFVYLFSKKFPKKKKETESK